MSTETGSLSIGDKSISLPKKDAVHGPSVLDISKLYAQSGMFTFDPGFTSTASCESGITFIDGDEGVLLHRGYPIEQLAEKGSFLETCYLLLYGELPSTEQFAEFSARVQRHTMVHEQMSRFFQGFRRDRAPDGGDGGSVGALSAFYHDATDISDPKMRMISSMRLIAKLPTLAAMAYKYTIGQPFVYPTTASTTPRTSSTCATRCRARNTRSRRSWRRRSTESSSCTPTTSRTAARASTVPSWSAAVGREPVRQHRRRRVPALWGPAPRRGQRGRAGRCSTSIHKGGLTNIPSGASRCAKDKKSNRSA